MLYFRQIRIYFAVCRNFFFLNNVGTILTMKFVPPLFVVNLVLFFLYRNTPPKISGFYKSVT